MSMESEYIPNQLTSDQFISQIPVNLMKENIKAQFEDPLEFKNKDHITPFITMYRFSKDNLEAYDDGGEAIDIAEIRDDFYVFMRKMFQLYLGIGFVDFDDYSETEQDELIHYTYRFFIMNIRKNFIGFILNHINKNRDSYIVDEDKKKDIISLSFKKEVTDPTDIYILSNLHSIISDILNEDITVDDFLEKCDDDMCLETRFVIDKFDNFVLVGNFVSKYIEMLDSDFIINIESKIRNKILRNYKKK